MGFGDELQPIPHELSPFFLPSTPTRVAQTQEKYSVQWVREPQVTFKQMCFHSEIYENVKLICRRQIFQLAIFTQKRLITTSFPCCEDSGVRYEEQRAREICVNHNRTINHS